MWSSVDRVHHLKSNSSVRGSRRLRSTPTNHAPADYHDEPVPIPLTHDIGYVLVLDMAIVLRMIKALYRAVGGHSPVLPPLFAPLSDEEVIKRQSRGNVFLQRGRYMTEEDIATRRAQFVRHRRYRPGTQ